MKLGPFLHLGKDSWPAAFPMILGQMLAPSISIPRRMPTSWSCSPVRELLGAPHESEQSNKQSALALLIETPLDYPLAYFAAGLCRSRLSRRQSLLDPATASPSGSNACSSPQSPFRLEAPIPRSASRRQYPVPPRGAILSSCLPQTLRVSQQGLDTGLGVRISLNHAHAWPDSL
jgi:hypothetical protein